MYVHTHNTHLHTLTLAHTHTYTCTHAPTHTHTLAHTLTHTIFDFMISYKYVTSEGISQTIDT